MKRALCLLTALLLAGGILFAGGTARAYANREGMQLVITRESGDPAAAGDAVLLADYYLPNPDLNYRYSLSWQTETAGGSTQTAYRYTQFPQQRTNLVRRSIDLYIGCEANMGVGCQMDNIREILREQEYSFPEALIDRCLALLEQSQAEGGQRQTALYPVSDFYSALPLRVGGATYLWDDSLWLLDNPEDGTVDAALTAYLNLPVPEHWYIQVIAERHDENVEVNINWHGSLREPDGSEEPAEDIWLDLPCALAADGLYFTVSPAFLRSQGLDSSVPGRYGLYCIPAKADETGKLRLDASDIRFLCPLEEDLDGLQLYSGLYSDSLMKDRVDLLTWKDGELTITQVSCTGGGILGQPQTVSVGALQGIELEECGDLTLLTCLDREYLPCQLILLQRNADETHSLLLSAPYCPQAADPDQPFYWWTNDRQFRYFNGKLYLVQANSREEIALTVISAQGMEYSAVYACSYNLSPHSSTVRLLYPPTVEPRAE